MCVNINTITCYRPKRSFGQGNIFTGVCDSVHKGGCLVLGGGVWSPIFRGRGGECLVSNFSGGGLVSNFLGGCLVSNFSGGEGGLRGKVKGGEGLRGGFFFDFCFLWGYTPPRDQTPEYSQHSAGTHPTGMHSVVISVIRLTYSTE